MLAPPRPVMLVLTLTRVPCSRPRCVLTHTAGAPLLRHAHHQLVALVTAAPTPHPFGGTLGAAGPANASLMRTAACVEALYRGRGARGS
jgi:hypothetical protein